MEVGRVLFKVLHTVLREERTPLPSQARNAIRIHLGLGHASALCTPCIPEKKHNEGTTYNLNTDFEHMR